MKQFLHLLRGILICLAAVVLFLSAIILWPISLGIIALRPQAVVDLLYDTKVF